MQKNKRELQKEETKKKLLAIAFTEFEKNGILSTRMSDIADAAGVSHGTVFLHFQTQETLISAVIEEFGSSVALRTHELARNCTGVREVLDAHLNGIMEYENFYKRLITEQAFLPKASRETLFMIQSAVSLHLSEAAQREMEAGTIKQVPIPLLFNTWIGLINYYLTNSDLFAPGESVLKRCGNQILEYYMSLLRSK
jgi:AcrR family transcriptional regulator